MAQPNQINPTFPGQVKAGAFEALHGNGVSTTALTLNGTTVKYFFGSSGSGFKGVVTGVFMTALTGTGSTVTVKGENGATICTLTAGSSNGSVSGANAALANTTISLTGTVSVSSSDAIDVGTVFLTYKTNED